MNTKAINAKAIELSKQVLTMTTAAKAGHPSSAVSLAHIVTCLMYHEMQYDPQNPWHPSADRLILSEGHAVPIIYAAYADLGGVVGNSPQQAQPLKLEELTHLRELGSVLDGHPNPAEGFPFFDAATGSLGMGLSVAAGLALAARLSNLDRRFYCIMGDGESREGQIAEALDFIADHKLTQVCAIFNCNGDGQAGPVSSQQSANTLASKLNAYGWDNVIIDGHKPDEILKALDQFHGSNRPFAIVAKTVKGWGIQSMLGSNFHGKPLVFDHLDEAMVSLDRMHVTCQSTNADAQSLSAPICKRPNVEQRSGTIRLPPFAEAIEHAGMSSALEKKRLATRKAYGAALNAMGTVDTRVVALDADVSNSTFSDLFARNHALRFFEGKIAEQNLVSVGVGLAAAGYVPFISSFGKFVARAYDQVELAVITRSNIKIVGSHAGLGPASDGPSQMSLSDVAFFRALCETGNGQGQPACRLFQPADAIAAYKCTELMANLAGPCYMRTHRPDVEFIYDDRCVFQAGGSNIIQRGRDITVLASGIMVHETLRACTLLKQEGIECTVIDAYTLPFDAQPILEAASETHHTIVCVEDNYGGGFGSAVAEAAGLYGKYQVHPMNVTQIPKSARTPQDLLEVQKLTHVHIAERIRSLCQTIPRR